MGVVLSAPRTDPAVRSEALDAIDDEVYRRGVVTLHALSDRSRRDLMCQALPTVFDVSTALSEDVSEKSDDLEQVLTAAAASAAFRCGSPLAERLLDVAVRSIHRRAADVSGMLAGLALGLVAPAPERAKAILDMAGQEVVTQYRGDLGAMAYTLFAIARAQRALNVHPDVYSEGIRCLEEARKDQRFFSTMPALLSQAAAYNFPLQEDDVSLERHIVPRDE